MKNLIPFSIIGLILLTGAFYAFTDSSESTESSTVVELRQSKNLIANQVACIDDLEASLYDFSFEISDLRLQNEFLLGENENLRHELKVQAQRAADLRQDLTNLEVENHNLERQLEQVLIGREIRARHQENNAEMIIAADMPLEAVSSEAEETQILEIQSQISTIESEIQDREEMLNEIAEETKATVTAIAANEAKVNFNIELEPASDPSISLNDPLVSNDVLYKAPVNAPRIFKELVMVDNDEDVAEANNTTDEFYSKSPIYSLIENTDVVYNYIACRNDRYGKKIKKLKREAKNWKYTYLQFNLEGENINLLLNKEFRVRVLATDLNTYVKFHTGLSHENKTHFDFVYEGEPIKLSIFNKEVKGKSFDIQVFHLVDGEEYLLEDDQMKLFNEGINMQSKLAANLPK